MARAATATINLDAIRHNYRLAKSVAPEQQAIAIIKADGYGHGAIKLAEALENEADAFGVACIEEAMELRAEGIQLPILLLEGFFAANELEYISNNNLWCAVHSLFQIDQIAAADIANPISVWLKMDSGMHRLGVLPEEYKEAYDKLVALPQVKEVVLMTHFSSADEPELDTTSNQIKLFDETTAGIDASVSLANSAGTLAHTNARRSWQRPGIMLYGATPFATSQELADQLKPAMTLSSEVIAIRDLQPGDAVGYSCTWICDKPTRVGTVAMGYADGYPRHANNGTPVLVNGKPSQIIGRVSMDMLAVDLTDIPEAEVGAYVELWGENLLASDVAKHCDTIPYTLFTGITRRVHKKYIES
ncbi:alanine racemase [Neptuniibacter sp.]|uniref:alanine racemase n=1 Tax=Neptuniibacter sp. TaxID=1962643 RepID=UPI002637B16C|nr:alanine racemase [Neptuniibacter sp.]MCP4595493.1 alanine racemase [Neptuniibacter sp.]